jgi:hypothetical protein
MDEGVVQKRIDLSSCRRGRGVARQETVLRSSGGVDGRWQLQELAMRASGRCSSVLEREIQDQVKARK